jgi:hypothetical protein
MATNRDIVSRVRSKHRLLNQDNQLSDRAILAELKSKASLLIKRETNLRKLWTSPNLFTTLSCVQMEEADISECCDYKGGGKIAKSKLKIPRVAEGQFGLIIQGVYNIVGSKKFIETNPNRYSNLLKLNLSGDNTYYWILNEHLYISKPEVEVVRMIAYFDEEVDPSIINPHCECDIKTNEDACVNPLDNNFKCPSYLVDAAVTMASQELLNSYFRIPTDKTSNQFDEQTQ